MKAEAKPYRVTGAEGNVYHGRFFRPGQILFATEQEVSSLVASGALAAVNEKAPVAPEKAASPAGDQVPWGGVTPASLAKPRRPGRKPKPPAA